LSEVVVVAEEVKEAVSEVQVQLVRQPTVVDPGLPAGGVQGEDDIAEMPWTAGARRGLPPGKAQDVGGAVLAAPLPVEDADAWIVGEEDGDLDVPQIEG